MVDQEQLVALLRQAGIKQCVHDIQPIVNQGVTNQVSLVTLQDGARFILRQYQWPWEGPDLNRLPKERYVHALLQRLGVPVPAILAHVEHSGHSVILMEYMPGEVLGDIAPSLPDEARREAWRSCGQVLRRAHSISFPAGTCGIIVGTRVQPFADSPARDDEPQSWGQGQIHMILDHYQHLCHHKPDLVDIDQELRSTLAAALPFLNRTPPTLLHNDAHPWNVLVQSVGEHWECSAWLDWEYAWVGDPNWDLVRMDLFRRAPLGATPDTFWEGYGRYPAQPERAVYEMHIFLWMANQYLSGDRHLLPTYEAAMTYVESLGEAVRGIQRWLNQFQSPAATRMLRCRLPGPWSPGVQRLWRR
jgi:aminoglycoside phosphotransferase (APT) family kinase protein